MRARIDGDAGDPSPRLRGIEELHWFEENQQTLISRYGGQWIAISGTTVVGVGVEAKDAYDDARRNGAADVAIAVVPTSVGEWDCLVV